MCGMRLPGELNSLDLVDAARCVASRDASPVELTAACIERIGTLDSKVNAFITVTDDDAIETARALARREGVSAGISAGAATWASLQVAARPDSKGKRIVTVICDAGERYVSAPFFAP